jgi:hypothetical protein
LLLWVDRTTGLAHCYESDKSQPGRHWYDRSLAFHAWASEVFQVSPNQLAGEVDWLFRRAVRDFAEAVSKNQKRLALRAEEQRSPYAHLGMPVPGEDPELVAIVQEVLAGYLTGEPPDEVWRALSERLQAHLAQENKRKNLVGEGFEDSLSAIIARLPCDPPLTGRTRVPIEDIPGFNAPRRNEKAKRVDLYVARPSPGPRILVTAKWSVRADREEQFASDFESYARLESAGEPFDYTLLTNEFDPARLVAACERSAGGRPLFTEVVHINPTGLLAAYGDKPKKSAKKVTEHIQSGRLGSLASWLRRLTHEE